jgi:hypothetical protein
VRRMLDGVRLAIPNVENLRPPVTWASRRISDFEVGSVSGREYLLKGEPTRVYI